MKIDFTDLRKEFRYMQERYGFSWVALRSVRLDERCACLDTYEMPSRSCHKCMGTGHLFVDKIVRAKISRSSPGVNLRSQVGIVNTTTAIWAIESAATPKSGDWILMLDLHESTGEPRQPFSIRRAFKLQNARPLRGKNGRIEYWSCLSEERNLSLGQPFDRSPSQLTPGAVEADYELRIASLEGALGALPLGSEYSFPLVNINDQAKELILIPQQSPPEGELKLTLLDETQTNITLYEQ